MRKADLIMQLGREFPNLTPREIRSAINCTFASIENTLTQGGRVELRRFGVFEIRPRAARPGRNPKTGEAVLVTAKQAILFTASQTVVERLNPHLVKKQSAY